MVWALEAEQSSLRYISAQKNCIGVGRVASMAIDEAEYLQKRVDDQIAWYSRNSQKNQRFYKRLRLIEILTASAIPLLSGYLQRFQALEFVIGGMGLIVAVVAGILSLYRFQEQWTEYRATCEALEREKFLYLTGAQPYDSEDPFPDFVLRIEGLLSQEREKWVDQMRSAQDARDQP